MLVVALDGGYVRAALSYWDANGADPGAGTSGQLAGTWGIDSFWSSSPHGTNSTIPWTDGNTPVFSAGTNATYGFTVSVGFWPIVGGLIFEEGPMTLGGSENAVITLTNAGGPIDVAAAAAPRIASVLSGTVGLTKTGSGTLFLVNTAPHTYTSYGGTTTNTIVSQGALSVGDGTPGRGFVDVNRGHVISNNATLIFDRDDTAPSCGAVITGTGSLIKKGTGRLKLQATIGLNSYAGDTLIEEGVLQCNQQIPHGPGKGNVLINTNGVLDVQGGDMTINGLSGFGAVTNSYGFDTNAPAHSARTNILTVGDNNQSSTFSGVIKQGNNTRSNHVVLHKIGTGTLTLAKPSTYYAAPTVIHAGTLLANNGSGSATGNSDVIAKSGATFGGIGTVNGQVTIEAGGTLSPGAAMVGDLTIDDSLILAGNVFIAVNKELSPSNDVAVVSGTITNAGTGTVTVTNVNPGQPFAPGDSFQIFSQAVMNGEALTIVSSGGVVWTNLLAINGSVAVLSVASGPVTPPPVKITSVTGVGTGSVTVDYTNAIPGTNYVLQYATNLNAGTWYDQVTNMAVGASASQTDNSAAGETRFYRVLTRCEP